MKINFDQKLLGIDDITVLKVSGSSDPLTLKKVCIKALTSLNPADVSITGDDKYQRFKLALKIEKGEELGVDEVSLLKKLVGQIWSPLVVGRAWDMLDPKEKKESEIA